MTLAWGDGELLGYDLTEAPPVEITERRAILDLLLLSTDDSPEGVESEDAAMWAQDETGSTAAQRAARAILLRACEIRARRMGYAYSLAAVREVVLAASADLKATPGSDSHGGLLRFRWLDGEFVCWEACPASGDAWGLASFWRQALHEDTPRNREDGKAGSPRWVPVPGDEDTSPLDEFDRAAAGCLLHAGPRVACGCPLLREILHPTMELLLTDANPEAALARDTLRVLGGKLEPMPGPVPTDRDLKPENVIPPETEDDRRATFDSPAPEWERGEDPNPAPPPAPEETTDANWMRKRADAMAVVFLLACSNDGTCRASYNIAIDPKDPAASLPDRRFRPCAECRDGVMVPRLTDDPPLADVQAWAEAFVLRGRVRGSRAEDAAIPCMICAAPILTTPHGPDARGMDLVALGRHGVEWLADVDCVISCALLQPERANGRALIAERRTVLLADSQERCASCDQPFTAGSARILLGPEHGPHYACHEKPYECVAAQEAAELRALRVAQEQKRDAEKKAAPVDWRKAKPHVLRPRADKRAVKCALCKLEIPTGIEVAMKLDRKLAHASCAKKEGRLVDGDEIAAQAAKDGGT